MGARARIRTRSKKKALPDSREIVSEPIAGEDRGESKKPEGAEPEAEVAIDAEMLRTLEIHAHAHATLISSDALRLIARQHDSLADHMETLDTIISLAKKRYPSESEWMVLNRERVEALLEEVKA